MRHVYVTVQSISFYLSAAAEVTGFDSPSVQGAGVSVSVITATAVSRYAPIRFPSVTHITRPLAGPYAQPGGTSRRNERADRTGLHRHGAVTDRVQFLVNAVNQALRPIWEQGTRPHSAPPF